MLISFIYVLTASYFETKVYGRIIDLPAVIIVHATISLTFSLVFFLGLLSLSTAIGLKKRIKDSQRAQDIAAYRKLWVKLAHLTTEIGNVLGPTMMEWLLIGSIAVIISCYSLIYLLYDIAAHNAIDQSEINSGVFFLVMSSILLIFLCEFGNRRTSSVGTKVQQELLRLSFTGRDKEFHQEVNLFIQTIHFRFPNFVLCGFITLNRQYLVSLISGGITYLIVLVQFRSNQNTEE
ncbi:unnamed protein product [Nezara viridula]|uniref:Gustatory receptor n=1 Tax=Nezara viridula TaxID=85310 RepID=A0A9P0E2M7_NEZVI|nr:unnamed protein product [Nezara viridula]